MISKEEAIKKVEDLLAERIPEQNPVILDEHTIEKEFGWVFFYQSKQYIETNDFQK